MAKEVAVFLGADGTSVSLDEPGSVAIFRRALGSWEKNREKGFSLGQVSGMRELRLKMGEILQFMDGCRIFVARSASGVPYFELEKAGCTVWEYSGRPAEFPGACVGPGRKGAGNGKSADAAIYAGSRRKNAGKLLYFHHGDTEKCPGGHQ